MKENKLVKVIIELTPWPIEFRELFTKITEHSTTAGPILLYIN